MPSDDAFTPSDFDPPSHLMSPENPTEYDAWLRARVEAALANPGPGIPHDVTMARMQAILNRHKNPT
ncbi:type II toxin-antitoxin system RelB family antitoxin [Sphingobium sp. Z007]|uniref:type II toxin-antitoxin system RelB family antitoxin n=1 Tax=Sphingobium sp. Z007 TaxID=627495 RepID=UPI00211B41D9|nr:addiction module antitoxin [Sphingobium sp. Z007]